MCRVIDDIYKIYGWDQAQPLDSHEIKLILSALFIAPPQDALQNTLTQFGPIHKNNLTAFVKELEQYKLKGSDITNLIKEFSVDDKINTSLLRTIITENGMRKQDLDELLGAAIGNERENSEIDVARLAEGLNSLSADN